MKTLSRSGFVLTLALLLLASVPVTADHPNAATSADLRALRTEANRLDDSMRTIDEGDPRFSEFRRREGEIRDDLVWLSGEIRRHQEGNREGGATKTDVESVRNKIRNLREDINAALDVAETRGDIDVPDGTEIQVRLEEMLSTRTARPEDSVTATVAQSVRSNGRVVIPAGTEARGIVESVQRAQRPSKGGRLEVAFDSLVVDGKEVDMDARVVRVQEGGIDRRRAGVGAVIGGVLGAVLDGGKGALIGAIVGGTGAVAASSGEDVELPAGTLLTVRLERPLAVARR